MIELQNYLEKILLSHFDTICIILTHCIIYFYLFSSLDLRSKQHSNQTNKVHKSLSLTPPPLSVSPSPPSLSPYPSLCLSLSFFFFLSLSLSIACTGNAASFYSRCLLPQYAYLTYCIGNISHRNVCLLIVVQRLHCSSLLYILHSIYRNVSYLCHLSNGINPLNTDNTIDWAYDA